MRTVYVVNQVHNKVQFWTNELNHDIAAVFEYRPMGLCRIQARKAMLKGCEESDFIVAIATTA